jgi:toxin YoeB
MEVIYSLRGQEDYDYWKTHQPKMINKIDLLLKDIKTHPFKGIGKPEPLKFEKTGYWSRRIDQQHRLVYKVANQKIYIVQCRYHY